MPPIKARKISLTGKAGDILRVAKQMIPPLESPNSRKKATPPQAQSTTAIDDAFGKGYYLVRYALFTLCQSVCPRLCVCLRALRLRFRRLRDGKIRLNNSGSKKIAFKPVRRFCSFASTFVTLHSHTINKFSHTHTSLTHANTQHTLNDVKRSKALP